jgi:hypothetical protein
MKTEIELKVELFVRRRHSAARDILSRERDAKLGAIRESLCAQGYGILFDPNDSRFSQCRLEYFNAVLCARADALFEAFSVYGLSVNDSIWRDLNRFNAQTVAGTIMSLRSGAMARANRTGRNSDPFVASAESFGRELTRSTHACLQSLWCEIEKRKQSADLHAYIPAESGSKGPAIKLKNNRIARRDLAIFAAILLGLEGLKYCGFLHDRGIRPKWSDTGHDTYPKSYQLGEPWRKRVQDEKARAKLRMKRYPQSELAAAFQAHLPDKLDELRLRLASRQN